MEDFAVLASFWGSNCFSPSWCDRAHINKSSKVDSEDIYIFIYYWMK